MTKAGVENKVGRTLARALLAVVVAAPGDLWAQDREEPAEREAILALMENRDSAERDQALSLVLELGPDTGPELAAAMIHAAWAELRDEVPRTGDGELFFAYMRAVAQLRDPRATPFLVQVLGFGPAVSDALADLAPGSFPAVYKAAGDLDPNQAGGALTALRFMVEDGSLDDGQVALVRETARERLTGMQGWSVARAAIRLALVLGDPELRGIVETLATDRATVDALLSPYLPSGNTASADYYDRSVDSLQEYARLFLFGGGADVGPTRHPFPRARREGRGR